MKPGEEGLNRHEYYGNVTTQKPDGEQIRSNYWRYKSHKSICHDENVAKGDYHVPYFSNNPMSKFCLISIVTSCVFIFAVKYDLVNNPKLFASTAMFREMERRNSTDREGFTTGQADDRAYNTEMKMYENKSKKSISQFRQSTKTDRFASNALLMAAGSTVYKNTNPT